jgi:surface carbohydrate biosynthesis protein
MQMRRRVVYLPIEITVRELDAKLLLAIKALEHGCEVIIGQKWLIEANVPYMPPGLIIAKTLTKRDGLTSRRAKEHGYVTAAIDEEMPGLVASKEKLRWVDPDTIAATDLIFCVGEEHRAAMIARFPETASRCHVVGNPRWDLLRPGIRNYYRPLAEELCRQHGRFILVNTNSGLVNSVKGSAAQVLSRHVRWGKIDPTKEVDQILMADRALFRESNFSIMKEIVHRLPERFPDHKIVLRPHPNEVVDTWREHLNGVRRVVIDQNHAAAAWILAAEALIHTNCTTGVEAYSLERPAICVEPAETETRLNYLSHHLNFIATDLESTMGAAVRSLSPSLERFKYPAEFAETYARFISASSGDLAVTRLLREGLENLPEQSMGRSGRAIWQPAIGYRNSIPIKAHNRKLMPVLTVDALRERACNLAEVTGGAGRLDGLQISRCGDNVFHLHQSRAVGYWSSSLAAFNWIGLPRPVAFS